MDSAEICNDTHQFFKKKFSPSHHSPPSLFLSSVEERHSFIEATPRFSSMFSPSPADSVKFDFSLLLAPEAFYPPLFYSFLLLPFHGSVFFFSLSAASLRSASREGPPCAFVPIPPFVPYLPFLFHLKLFSFCCVPHPSDDARFYGLFEECSLLLLALSLFHKYLLAPIAIPPLDIFLPTTPTGKSLLSLS